MSYGPPGKTPPPSTVTPETGWGAARGCPHALGSWSHRELVLYSSPRQHRPPLPRPSPAPLPGPWSSTARQGQWVESPRATAPLVVKGRSAR